MQPAPLRTRLGPRPLPLHLGTALMTWVSSESAWKLWKPGSPSSSPSSAAPDSIAALLPEIAALEAKAGAGKFEAALHREIARRMARLADGVLAYRRHAVHRTLDDPPAVWSEGNTRLLDYGATHRAARRARSARRAGGAVADQSLGGARPHGREEPAARDGRAGAQALSRRLGNARRRGAALRHHGLCRAPRAGARLPGQARAPGAGGDGLLHGRHARGGAGRAPAAPGRGAGAAGRPVGLPCRSHGPCLPRLDRAAPGARWRTGWASCRSTSCRPCSGRSIPGWR